MREKGQGNRNRTRKEIKMTATYTTRYEILPTIEFAGFPEWTKELPLAARTALMLIIAPLLGLGFVIALPVAGLALAAWMAAKVLARRCAGAAPIVKRTALFFAAPFVGLAYLIAFPFVGAGALLVYGVRAARK
jgi:hypothetical protein